MRSLSLQTCPLVFSYKQRVTAHPVTAVSHSVPAGEWLSCSWGTVRDSHPVSTPPAWAGTGTSCTPPLQALALLQLLTFTTITPARGKEAPISRNMGCGLISGADRGGWCFEPSVLAHGLRKVGVVSEVTQAVSNSCVTFWRCLQLSVFNGVLSLADVPVTLSFLLWTEVGNPGWSPPQELPSDGCCPSHMLGPASALPGS